MANQKGLNQSQLQKMSEVKPAMRGAMVRHAKAKVRSVKHNNEMISNLKKGKSVVQAHDIAVKKVGL